MMQSVWWIREIDWRISAGVIFFIWLALWQEKEKKDHFVLRMAACFVLLCGVSFCIRFCLETWLTVRLVVAFGYSFNIMLLSVCYIFCYSFCYRCPKEESVFGSILAMTVYRVCWDAVKLLSAIPVSPEATWTNGSPFQSILSYTLYVALAAVCYRIYTRFVKGPVIFPERTLRTVFTFILLCQMLLEFSYQLLYTENGGNGALFFLTAFLYSVVNCILLSMAAYMAQLREENLSIQNFLRSKQQYYEISREGILSLQIKCHDLKHQIARLRSAEGQRQLEEYMKSLADSIDEYNTVVECGNKNIDVVLTEKNIICSMNGVRFTYIIDGTLFDFLTDMEIYALFGNAMDNALEGMENVTHPERKFISLRAAGREDGGVILVLENYFEHEVLFEDGMPVTTKMEENHHGFGLRSIMAIAKEHGGSASVQAEDNIFTLTVYMRGNR